MADMTAAAVTARLKRASELAALCVKLSRARADPADATAGHCADTPRDVREESPRHGDDR
jgi:hypothetical protein